MLNLESDNNGDIISLIILFGGIISFLLVLILKIDISDYFITQLIFTVISIVLFLPIFTAFVNLGKIAIIIPLILVAINMFFIFARSNKPLKITAAVLSDPLIYIIIYQIAIFETFQINL